MKKILFSLALCSVVITSLAQTTECAICPMPLQSQTQTNFNATFVKHRHIVNLQHGNKMIVELFDTRDYDILANIDSIFTNFRRALVPFKDSLHVPPSGHLRIDYAYNSDQVFRKIRIKKYYPNGETFIENKGEINNLKVEQDTIRILIEKMKTAPKNKYGETYKLYKPVQVTLVLNNYTDIDKLIANKVEIQHYIDTMSIASKPKVSKRFNPLYYRSTILYHPYAESPSRYSGKYKFLFYKGVTSDEYSNLYWVNPVPKRFAFIADIGASIVRDKISPMADAGFEYRFPHWLEGDQYISIFKLTIAPYMLFDKTPSGSYGIYDNWFVHAELGSLSYHEQLFSKTTFGIGYLLKANGTYFQGTTMKTFFNFTLKNQFIICPEVIVTNDFHSIFPGVTFKGFLNRD